MGLRDWIKRILPKSFGQKRLNEGQISQGIAKPIDANFTSELDAAVKVSGLDEISKLSFSEIEAEYESTLKEVAENYKNTILSDATLQRIKAEELKTGKIGETPFICTVEMDSTGNFKTTVIVTEKSCSKVKEDKNGNIIYQETRIDGKEMKTVVNTKDTSLVITGDVTQEEIDKIKQFSENNKKNISTLKTFDDNKINEEYKKTLKELDVKQDIDLANTNDYMTSCTGRLIRDEKGKLKRLEEMSLVLDKKNKNKDPLIISFNTLEKGNKTERKFVLTKNGNYIDESSFRLEDGKPVYAEFSLNDIKKLAKVHNLDDKFIDKAKKINRENVQLVPPVAKALHEKVKTEFEKGKPANEKTEPKNGSAHPDEVLQEHKNLIGEEKKVEYADNESGRDDRA